MEGTCVFRLFCFVITALGHLSRVVVSEEITSNEPSKHPMLFFGADDIPGLRQKAKTTHKKIADEIKAAGREMASQQKDYLPPESFEKFSSFWNEVYGNNICAFAMYCVLFPEDQQALDAMKVYMDRMESYPDWYVASSKGKDQVPIGHSLAGFATAFDFLYNRLEPERVAKYLEKLREVTEMMYDIARKESFGWAKQIIHNHAPTNCLSFLLGAMVLENHEPPGGLATKWKKKGIEQFEKAMILLSYVVDGTSDEGVAYGSYSSRGWTQYAFLARRHFGKDHSLNPWFTQHFWFFYATVLPGYQRSVGIADSNHNWFYGPESQLVFLDAWVMRNGYGNWLADRIREARKTDEQQRSGAQKWSTIHTEFLFYDATIAPVEPVLPNGNKLHVFSDWGVATFGGGLERKPGHSFLSMKSGAIHGEAISAIVEEKLLPSAARQWTTFNAGHEHPDQNSFVFSPNGHQFITEALYSVKMTYLNNALIFAPYDDSKCNGPWIGQIGECLKWLGYQNTPSPRGRIVAAIEQDNMVFLASDAVDAYSPELGLKSVQRSMVLVRPDVLLVLDTVQLKTNSKLKKVGAFFHNIHQAFQEYEHLGYQGAKMDFSDGAYAMVWFTPNGASPRANLRELEIACEYKFRTTRYVNLTYSMEAGGTTQMAYLFTGPRSKLNSAVFLESMRDGEMTRIAFKINSVAFDVQLASLGASLTTRMAYFQSGSFGQVTVGEKSVVFGQSKATGVTYDRCQATDDATLDAFMRALITSPGWESRIMNLSKISPVRERVGSVWLAAIFLTLLFALCFCYRRRQYTVTKAKRLWTWALVIGAIWIVISYKYFLNDVQLTSCTIPYPSEKFVADRPSTVVISSLPGSGSQLLRFLFKDSSEYIFLRDTDVTIPSESYDVMKYDTCYWPTTGKEGQRSISAWFSKMAVEPQLFLENLKGYDKVITAAREKFQRLNGSPKFVLSLRSGFWNSKLAWLLRQSTDEMRFIVVVRDPRDWIFSLIRTDVTKERLVNQRLLLRNVLNKAAHNCPKPFWLPFEFQSLAEETPLSRVEHLAKLWVADVSATLRLSRSVQIVRYQELVSNPEFMAREIMKRLGTTVSVPQMNFLARATKSGHYSFGHEPPVRDGSHLVWRSKMRSDDIGVVDRICGDLMDRLRFRR